MEKVMSSTGRLAVVAATLFLVLAAGSLLQEADAADTITYPSKMISCKALGNCEKSAGATRPGAVANRYTRGCSAINRCRG